MKGQKDIFIVIAAFNEEKSISGVISRLKNAGYRNIVVVDDCSKDRTYKLAEAQDVHVLRHIINRGQGAALRTGIEYALDHGADVIVTFDADGQHRVEDLPAMVRPVLDGEVEVTLGSRFLRKTGTEMPFFRRILLKGSLLVQNLFYGIRLTDAHNGFRALSRKAAQKINITADRMAHASQIVEQIHKKGISFREVPVKILYTEETVTKGHGSFSEAVRVLFRMIYSRIMR